MTRTSGAVGRAVARNRTAISEMRLAGVTWGKIAATISEREGGSFSECSLRHACTRHDAHAEASRQSDDSRPSRQNSSEPAPASLMRSLRSQAEFSPHPNNPSKPPDGTFVNGTPQPSIIFVGPGFGADHTLLTSAMIDAYYAANALPLRVVDGDPVSRSLSQFLGVERVMALDEGASPDQLSAAFVDEAISSGNVMVQFGPSLLGSASVTKMVAATTSAAAGRGARVVVVNAIGPTDYGFESFLIKWFISIDRRAAKVLFSEPGAAEKFNTICSDIDVEMMEIPRIPIVMKKLLYQLSPHNFDVYWKSDNENLSGAISYLLNEMKELFTRDEWSRNFGVHPNELIQTHNRALKFSPQTYSQKSANLKVLEKELGEAIKLLLDLSNKPSDIELRIAFDNFRAILDQGNKEERRNALPDDAACRDSSDGGNHAQL